MKHITSEEKLIIYLNKVRSSSMGLLPENFVIHSHEINSNFYIVKYIKSYTQVETEYKVGFLFWKKTEKEIHQKPEYEEAFILEVEDIDRYRIFKSIYHVYNEDLTKKFIKVVDDRLEKEHQAQLKINALFEEKKE